MDSLAKISQGVTATARPRSAYLALADHLRTLILDRELQIGERLPGENQLGELFGVSRSTVREAMRVLESEHLVEVTRGAHGGTFVSVPNVDDVASSLGTLLGVMVGSEECSIGELVDVRRIIEVQAAELAARERREAPLRAMRLSLPTEGEEASLTTAEFFQRTSGFHIALLECTGNRALEAIGRPLYFALHNRLKRELADVRSLGHIFSEHRQLLALIESGSARKAGRLMRDHLDTVEPVYDMIEDDASPTTTSEEG